jgi:nicotinamidase-related amidase
MPVTTLDPKTALVVIDLQKGVVAIPTVHPMATVVANAAKLAHAFRRRGAPVALVNVAGGAPGRTDIQRPPMAFPPDWTELAPELEVQPTDLLVTKYSVGAFYGTSLELHLRRHGVTQIVLCGVATSSGVEATARGAFDRGYHVTLVTDAMTDRVAEAHTHSVERIFPRLGECGLTVDVLAKLT